MTIVELIKKAFDDWFQANEEILYEGADIKEGYHDAWIAGFQTALDLVKETPDFDQYLTTQDNQDA